MTAAANEAPGAQKWASTRAPESTPNGIRTRAAALKGRSAQPPDQGRCGEPAVQAAKNLTVADPSPTSRARWEGHTKGTGTLAGVVSPVAGLRHAAVLIRGRALAQPNSVAFASRSSGHRLAEIGLRAE
ncbi:MAG: hypothetical protein ACP5P1_02235 [Acidimicrobiales bacterium]